MRCRRPLSDSGSGLIASINSPSISPPFKVGSGNRQEFEAVKNAPVYMTGLIENAVIELKPAKIPADVVTFLNLLGNFLYGHYRVRHFFALNCVEVRC